MSFLTIVVVELLSGSPRRFPNRTRCFWQVCRDRRWSTAAQLRMSCSLVPITSPKVPPPCHTSLTPFFCFMPSARRCSISHQAIDIRSSFSALLRIKCSRSLLPRLCVSHCCPHLLNQLMRDCVSLETVEIPPAHSLGRCDG
jgi:hypothetical protein